MGGLAESYDVNRTDMRDRIVAWLGRTPRERAFGVAALMVCASLLYWMNRDDLLPPFLLWAGFAVAIAGVHRLYRAEPAPATRSGGILVVLGLAMCAAAESFDGGRSRFGFMLMAFVVVGVARNRRHAMSGGTRR